MKKILIFLLLNSIVYLKAQNQQSDNNTIIELNSYVYDDIEGMTEVARKNLDNKLSQIITNNGLGIASESSRFILTADIDILTKDITSTVPPMQAYTLNVNFIIGDGIDGVKFSTYSTTVKGVGENETKAYLAALKNIKVSDPQYSTFINNAKEKIINYYNKKCDNIINNAKLLASQNQYAEALYELSTIPVGCKPCFDKVSPVISSIYKSQINYECKKLLLEATNIWNANQNIDGANSASEVLNQINPAASCYNEVKELTKKIGNKILADDKKEWDFKLKVYNDAVSTYNEELKAAREIALEYAKSETVVYNVVSWY